MATTLIEPQQLAVHLDDPDWAVIDCRFDLAQPGWGAQSWAHSHIPGALHADLERDLSGPRTPGSGRHPLPAPDVLAATFGRLGIDARVQVVAYDQGPGMYAARLWWLLRWLGHEAVAVLNGGFAGWQRAGLPVSEAPGARPARQFRAHPDAQAVVNSAQVAAWVAQAELQRGTTVLADARAADRFAGQNETLDPVAGHVPGARNHPFAGNLGPDGRFLSPQELRRRWEQTLRGQAPQRLVAMCGSGVTACHNLLALELAGLPGARLYAGSWSEWIGDPARPLERGP